MQNIGFLFVPAEYLKLVINISSLVVVAVYTDSFYSLEHETCHGDVRCIMQRLRKQLYEIITIGI